MLSASTDGNSSLLGQGVIHMSMQGYIDEQRKNPEFQKLN